MSYVMRVSAVLQAAVRCCNTANSSLTIDGKFEILNKRIGSVRAWKFITFNPALHIHKPLWCSHLFKFYCIRNCSLKYWLFSFYSLNFGWFGFLFVWFLGAANKLTHAQKYNQPVAVLSNSANANFRYLPATVFWILLNSF